MPWLLRNIAQLPLIRRLGAVCLLTGLFSYQKMGQTLQPFEPKHPIDCTDCGWLAFVWVSQVI